MNVVSINHLPGRVIYINDLEYLFFSGTNYLGIGCNEQFRSILIQEMARYGTIYSSSRNSNLHLSIYREAEAFFAQKYGFEDALLTTSGLLAGQLALAALNNKKIIYAPSAHPAIKRQEDEAWHQRFDSGYPAFAQEIAAVAESVDGPVVIASNTLDNIRCEKYDFAWIKNLPGDKEISLLFDYSHGIGLLELDDPILSAQQNQEVIVIASLAKGLGLPGGVILASKEIVSAIRSHPLFIGASPMVPAYLSAFMKTASLYEDCLKQLQENIAYFNCLNTFPFQRISNFPVYYTPVDIYNELFEKGIFVSNFSYPHPQDRPLTRIVLNAVHTRPDMEKLTEALNGINQ